MKRILTIVAILSSFILYTPATLHAEIFYILPRLGLNITMLQDGKISGPNGSFSIKDTTDATFALSLAGGVHFSRIPLRLEVDMTFRTQGELNGSEYYNTLSSKTYQLTTMLNVFYDIYLSAVPLVPYIGVGIGFTTFFVDSKATISNQSYTANVLANVDFSWNVIAGFSYPIDRFLLDFSVRFVDSGKPKLVASPLSSRARIMGFDFLLGLRIPL